jgi:UDP:flavonoid glycosyltransferase YjiC (YdhE family)
VLLLAQFRENLAMLPAIRHELQTIWQAERPDMVVADSVAPVGGLVCDALGIPWITTIGTPFAIENRRGVPAYCGGWSPGGWPARDALGRFVIRNFKRAVAWYFRREFALLGGGFPHRADGTERIYSPRAILGFGIRELEFARDWPPAFEMIGPVIDCPDEGPALNFPQARKRVLVSVGTHLLWAKRELVGNVVRLAESFPEVHFVVSMGGHGESIVCAAPRVTVYPFVPYQRDLHVFDAVIHHGGAGVTYAAILKGVPSVVVPHDYDQFDYAARVAYHGLGVRARSIREAGAGLREVLDRPRRAQLAAMRAHAERYRPAARFLDILRSHLPHSSTE